MVIYEPNINHNVVGTSPIFLKFVWRMSNEMRAKFLSASFQKFLNKYGSVAVSGQEINVVKKIKCVQFLQFVTLFQ